MGKKKQPSAQKNAAASAAPSAPSTTQPHPTTPPFLTPKEKVVSSEEPSAQVQQLSAQLEAEKAVSVRLSDQVAMLTARLEARTQDIATPSQLEAAEQAEAELRKQNEDLKAKLDLKASQCSTLAVQLNLQLAETRRLAAEAEAGSSHRALQAAQKRLKQLEAEVVRITEEAAERRAVLMADYEVSAAQAALDQATGAERRADLLQLALAVSNRQCQQRGDCLSAAELELDAQISLCRSVEEQFAALAAEEAKLRAKLAEQAHEIIQLKAKLAYVLGEDLEWKQREVGEKFERLTRCIAETEEMRLRKEQCDAQLQAHLAMLTEATQDGLPSSTSLVHIISEQNAASTQNSAWLSFGSFYSQQHKSTEGPIEMTVPGPVGIA